MDAQEQTITPHHSEQNITHLYNEQSQISKAFQPSNFYLNERFNIKQLKQKIQYRKQQQQLQTTLKAHHFLIKSIRKDYDLSPKQHSPPFAKNNQHESFPVPQQTTKQAPKGIFDRSNKHKYNMSSKRRLTQNKQPKNYILRNKQQVKSYDHSARQQSINKQHRYRRAQSTNHHLHSTKIQQTTNHKPIKQQYFNQSKINTLIHKQRQYSILHPEQKPITPFYEPLQRKIMSRLVKTKTQGEESRFSGVQTQNSFNWGMQGRLLIESNSQLFELQTKITILWQHYELLSRILQITQKDIERTKLFISKYRDTVCSNNLDFIRELVQGEGGSSKKQAQFMKRFKKGVIVSRLYEHISILFLALWFYQKIPLTHLTNMIGYASSNLCHLIKLLLLSHHILTPLKLSQSIQEKILVITSFQVGSYRKELTKISQILMRIQQNNNVMTIIKNKLPLQKQFATRINQYLKINQPDHPLQQYSQYIFQYFAFNIVSNNQYGVIQFIQIAPSPYLTLSKPRTVVIEPWHVLLSMKGEATFIRAYSELFLKQISRHCNIVYWTDLLPDQINNLLQKMPPGYILYRYHCKYQEGGFVKLLGRLGSDLDNTIIVDRSQANFRHDKEMGVELPWSGRRRDMKLLNFLQTLQYIFEQKTTFREGFAKIKSDLANKNSAYKSKLQKSYGVIRQNYGSKLLRQKY